MPVNNLIQLRKGINTDWSTTNPVLASGEPGYNLTDNILKIGDGTNTWSDLSSLMVSDIQVYVKNTTGSSLTKGQAVYIDGAQGDNPTIALAVASSESTSSKTLGLLKQNLGVNEFGYVVSEGFLEGIDTDQATSAGDPMWLSPTVSGGIVYGVSNKPVAPNHMVFLGYVLRKQQNNGKVYVKVQNGFELGELHNVFVNGTSDGSFLQYNSSSGLWLASSSGNFTTLQVNNTGVSISGHTHTSSAITDWNEAVDDRVSSLLVGNSGIYLSYNDSSNTLTISYTGSIGGGGGGGITDIVQDTTPQLGGDLDLNGYAISGSAFYTSPTGTIIGNEGWIYQSGQTVLSQGSFGNKGDAQYSQYLLRNNTTTANWTSLKNNDSTAILLASNRTYSFTINILGRSTNTTNNAAYKLEGLLYNDANGCSLIGTPIKTILGETDSSWDARVIVSGGGSGQTDYLLTQVSGAVSTNINWLAKVDLLELGGYEGNYELNMLNIDIDNSFIP